MKICLVDETGAGDGALSVLAVRWNLTHDEDNLMALVMTPEHLELRKRDEPKLGGIFVDFVGGAMAHRRKFGGGRGEAVAKAVGIKGDYLPDVVDATAGLGRDAFVLASVGCRVRMLERNPVVAAQMNFTVGIFPAHLFRVRDDLLDVTLQEVDAGNVKQGLQRGDQGLYGAFIKAWADTQLWLWCNYCNINGLLMFIRQSCGA